MHEPRIAQRATHALAGLGQRRVRQAHDGHAGQTGRDIDLDPDDPPDEALERGGEQRGQHAATLRTRAYR